MSRATEQFRKELEDLAAETGLDNLEGLYPLDSEWRRLGVSYSTFFGAARALLLQIAHPTVAQGVFEYSDFKNSPVGRGVRTFFAVLVNGLGTQRVAVKIGALVFDKHLPIKGTIPSYEAGMPDRKYSAMEPGANLWVWSTLVEGVIFGHQEVNHQVPKYKLERMYQEAKTFARFFNVKPQLIPKTLEDFQEYFQDMVDNQLEVTPAAREVCRALVEPQKYPAKPFGAILKALPTESLPPRIRDAFGFESTPQTRRIYQGFQRIARDFYARAPESMKSIPIAYMPNIRVAAGKLPGVRKTQDTVGKLWSKSSDVLLGQKNPQVQQAA